MTTPEDLKNIAPGSLVFFGYMGEYVAVVLKQKSCQYPPASAYVVLWPSGVVQSIFFWPAECKYVTIIPPNPDTED